MLTFIYELQNLYCSTLVKNLYRSNIKNMFLFFINIRKTIENIEEKLAC